MQCMYDNISKKLFIESTAAFRYDIYEMEKLMAWNLFYECVSNRFSF